MKDNKKCKLKAWGGQVLWIKGISSSKLNCWQSTECSRHGSLNGGLRLQVLEPTVMAVTGAETEVWITYIGADKVKVKWLYQPIAFRLW